MVFILSDGDAVVKFLGLDVRSENGKCCDIHFVYVLSDHLLTRGLGELCNPKSLVFEVIIFEPSYVALPVFNASEFSLGY